MPSQLRRLHLGDKIVGLIVGPLIVLYGLYCLIAGDAYLAALHHWTSDADRNFLAVSGAAAFRVGIAYIGFGVGLHVTSAWKRHEKLAPWYETVGLGAFVLGLLAYLWAIEAV